MNPDFDVRTSKTLLGKLRVFEDRNAWSQFLKLYLPMIRAWGRRFGLRDDDVEELAGRLLAKLVEALPRFDYDPGKGSFRGWLKTVTQREVSNLARERRRRLPGAEATGRSAVYDLLLQHADDVDDLVASLHDRSDILLRSVQDALKEVQGACQGEEQKSWELFRRIFLEGQAIEPVAAAFGLSYHAAAMRVQRIKKKVRSRAMELALGRGLTP
jgi:RNA polymerase sigma-70 factor (ECF subfamily)